MSPKVDADSRIEDIVRKYPEVIDVFMNFGINPIVCGEPAWGTILEEVEKANIDIDIDILLKELNDIIEE
jgi:iron-sulfur cluster repair protein YtfE (RIC family)